MWPLSGQEVVQAVRGQCRGEGGVMVSGAVSDSRRVGPGDLFVAIRGEKFDGHDFVRSSLEKGAVLALVSRSWEGLTSLPENLAARCIVVEDSQAGFRRLAAFLRTRFSFPVVGIGGSNGKTTTKEMLSALLSGGDYQVTKTEKSENGFLGLAITLCNRSHAVATTPQALVLEIGIDDIGAMDEHLSIGQPDVVLLTALGPEHLAHLKNWETAVAEELKMFRLCGGARRIWQLEEPELAKLLHEVRAGDVVVVSRRRAAELGIGGERDFIARGVSVLFFEVSGTEVRTKVALAWHGVNGSSGTWSQELPLPGHHNACNFALACATALGLGRTMRELEAGWKCFVPPPMRSRLVEFENGCILFDDCYNASPASMKAALDILRGETWKDRSKLVILGDMLDLGSESRKWHLELVESLKPLANVHLCFFGDAMYDVFQEMQNDSANAGRQRRTVSHMRAADDPSRFLESSPVPLAGAVVLVKGSRGMDLGRVVARIEEKCR